VAKKAKKKRRILWRRELTAGFVALRKKSGKGGGKYKAWGSCSQKTVKPVKKHGAEGKRESREKGSEKGITKAGPRRESGEKNRVTKIKAGASEGEKSSEGHLVRGY